LHIYMRSLAGGSTRGRPVPEDGSGEARPRCFRVRTRRAAHAGIAAVGGGRRNGPAVVSAGLIDRGRRDRDSLGRQRRNRPDPGQWHTRPRITFAARPKTARSNSICTVVTTRAAAVTGTISPNPTVASTVSVKYSASVWSRGFREAGRIAPSQENVGGGEHDDQQRHAHGSAPIAMRLRAVPRMGGHREPGLMAFPDRQPPSCSAARSREPSGGRGQHRRWNRVLAGIAYKQGGEQHRREQQPGCRSHSGGRADRHRKRRGQPEQDPGKSWQRRCEEDRRKTAPPRNRYRRCPRSRSPWPQGGLPGRPPRSPQTMPAMRPAQRTTRPGSTRPERAPPGPTHQRPAHQPTVGRRCSPAATASQSPPRADGPLGPPPPPRLRRAQPRSAF
jgi:hypothetical protein